MTLLPDPDTDVGVHPNYRAYKPILKRSVYLFTKDVKRVLAVPEEPWNETYINKVVGKGGNYVR